MAGAPGVVVIYLGTCKTQSQSLPPPVSLAAPEGRVLCHAPSLWDAEPLSRLSPEGTLTSAGSLLSPLCPPRPRSLAALSTLSPFLPDFVLLTQVGKHECLLCAPGALMRC